MSHFNVRPEYFFRPWEHLRFDMNWTWILWKKPPPNVLELCVDWQTNHHLNSNLESFQFIRSLLQIKNNHRLLFQEKPVLPLFFNWRKYWWCLGNFQEFAKEKKFWEIQTSAMFYSNLRERRPFSHSLNILVYLWSTLVLCLPKISITIKEASLKNLTK